LRFDSKAHGLDAFSTPQQGSDGANQHAPKPRPTDGPPAQGAADRAEQNQPTPALPMNRPPPTGRSTSQAADDANGGRDAKR
jgi:large repetitive protein